MNNCTNCRCGSHKTTSGDLSTNVFAKMCGKAEILKKFNTVAGPNKQDILSEEADLVMEYDRDLPVTRRICARGETEGKVEDLFAKGIIVKAAS